MSPPPSPSMEDYTPDPRRWLILAVLMVALFMSLIDVSIVNVALPSIQLGLDASQSQLQWVLSGYALAFGIGLVAAGRAGDIYGRGALFIIGVAIFTASSIACGLAQDANLLNIARAFQGIGFTSRRRPTLAKLKRWIPVDHDAETNRWNGPFIMASFDTRIVRLSNTLTDWSYGREFRYREVTDFGSSPLSPLKAGGMAIGLGAVLAGLAFRPTRALLDRVLPKPGDGPNAEQRATGRFRVQIRTTTTTGARYLTKVGADYDTGYNGTAIMLGESALSLALDGDRLPQRSGVLTPATAMGDVLVERLRARGFVFDTSVEAGEAEAAE